MGDALEKRRAMMGAQSVCVLQTCFVLSGRVATSWLKARKRIRVIPLPPSIRCSERERWKSQTKTLSVGSGTGAPV